MENPAVPLSDPEPWLFDAWGGGPSSSGISVNAESALTYSPVWRAANLLSRDVAKLPLVVYRRRNEGKERAPKHKAYFPLKYKANPEMTSFQLRMLLQLQGILRGNGYGFISRGGGKLELWPIDASKVTVIKPQRPGEEVFYLIRRDDGQVERHNRENIFHLRGLGDGYEGKSVIAKARESFGLGLAAQKYGSVFFKNSATPSAVLEHPGKMTPEANARLRQSWQEIHGDLDNKHRMAILEEGMKINPFGLNNEDAQFLQTRQFEIREVANWFGVPPHKLGDTTRTAFASLEQENQSYLDDALDPWLVNWEMECWDKLLSEDEKLQDTHIIEFTRQALLRADMAGRSAFYASAIQNGWMNRDEVRSRENLNEIPDGEGQKFFVPKNMGLSGEEEGESDGLPPGGGGAADPEPPEGDSQAGRALDTAQAEKPPEIASQGPSQASQRIGPPYRALLCDLLARLSKRITAQATRRAKNPDQFMDWVEGPLLENNRRSVVESCHTVMSVLAEAGLKKNSHQLSEMFFHTVQEAFLESCDTKPTDLEASVAKACERIETSFPSVLTERFLET